MRLSEVDFINVVGSEKDKAEYYNYESWIKYYNTKHIWFKLETCACCNKKPTPENPLVGGHIFAKVYNEWDLFIVPICNKCNLKYGDNKVAPKFFRILKIYLCPHPNPTTALENINIKEP